MSVPRNQYKGLNLRDLAKWEQVEKGLFKHLPRTWLVFFFRQKASFFFSRQVVGGMKLLNYSLLYVRNFKPNTIGPRSFIRMYENYQNVLWILDVWELCVRCMRIVIPLELYNYWGVPNHFTIFALNHGFFFSWFAWKYTDTF